MTNSLQLLRDLITSVPLVFHVHGQRSSKTAKTALLSVEDTMSALVVFHAVSHFA